MGSIRTKITLLVSIAVITAVSVSSFLGVSAIIELGANNSHQLLALMCETGKKNLDEYFESVEQSVTVVSHLVEQDIDGLDDAQLAAHMERAREVFNQAALSTNGVLTYYYRVDPEVSRNVKGFWYVAGPSGFEPHEVTDITLYDTADTSALVWFTKPKAEGVPLWLSPYITDNLDVRVLSYNAPIYYEGRFVGVIGIEIDYSIIAEQVSNIRLYDNGYAFLTDGDGQLIFHPFVDVASTPEELLPDVPANAVGENELLDYIYEGVEKKAVWRPLVNGMRLVVSAPVSELNGEWEHLAERVGLAGVALLVIFIIVAVLLSNRITRPLRQLTRAARQVEEGDYDVELDYGGNDETAQLSRTVGHLVAHLDKHITTLNNLAYADALTSVHNRGAFDIHVGELQARVDSGEVGEFAIAVFDCDNLKQVNDLYGHGEGNVYLKHASASICEVFAHSPVFRIGGDEFAAILVGQDYEARERLLQKLAEKDAGFRTSDGEKWASTHLSTGVAVYDASSAETVRDVVTRADALMYENKHVWKSR